MALVFSKDDAVNFYHIFYNEINSVKNTEENANALLNMLEVIDGMERVLLLEVVKNDILDNVKKIAFSSKYVVILRHQSNP